MKLPVYISGPMTGHKDNNKEEFMKAETMLLNAGVEMQDIINPVRLEIPGADYERQLVHDLKYLKNCQSVWLLKGWRTSHGARVEKGLADELGIRCYGYC